MKRFQYKDYMTVSRNVRYSELKSVAFPTEVTSQHIAMAKEEFAAAIVQMLIKNGMIRFELEDDAEQPFMKLWVECNLVEDEPVEETADGE